MKTSFKKTKHEYLYILIILIFIMFLYFLFFSPKFSQFNKKKIIENLPVGKIKEMIGKLDKSSEEGGESSDNFLNLAGHN